MIERIEDCWKWSYARLLRRPEFVLVRARSWLYA